MMNSLYFLVVILTIYEVMGYPGRLTDSSSGCNKDMTPGSTLMGFTSVASTQIGVSFYRGETELSSGDTYISGETLKAKTSRSSNVVMEIDNGAMVSGKCSNTRIDSDEISVTMPNDGNDVNLWAAWASSKTQVKISSTFTLVPGVSTDEPTSAPSGQPTDVPTATPSSSVPSSEPTSVPSSEPTWHPSGEPSSGPSGAPTAGPSLPNETVKPTNVPTSRPTMPTGEPTGQPTVEPSVGVKPSGEPTGVPTGGPTSFPTMPTGQPTGIPTGEPTLGPAEQGYNIEAAFKLEGFATDEITDDMLVDIADSIAASIGVNAERVVIKSYTTVSMRRRLADGVEFKVSITGFDDAEDVSSSKDTLVSYIADSSSSGFAQELTATSSFTSVGVTVGTVVVDEIEAVDAVENESFDFSCDLSSRLTLNWRVESSGVVAQATAAEGDGGWVAFGLVKEGSKEMVANPNHRVFIYAVGSSPGIFRLNQYTPSYQADTATRTNTYVDAVFASTSETGMTMVIASNTGVASDVALEKDGMNTVIFASGKGNLEKHESDGRGFAIVDWADGTCDVVTETVPIYAGLAFLVPGLCIIGHLFLTFIKRAKATSALANFIHEGFANPSSTRIGVFMPPLYLASVTSNLVVTTHIIVLCVVTMVQYQAHQNAGSDEAAFASALGIFTVMNLWITILFTAKSNLFFYLTGVPFSRLIKFHKASSVAAMATAVFHFIKVLDIYEWSDVLSNERLGLNGEAQPRAGLLAFWSMVILTVTSIGPIRQWLYELFVGLHFLWVAVVIFTAMHVPWTIYGFIPGLIIQAVGTFVTSSSFASTPFMANAKKHVVGNGRTVVTLDVTGENYPKGNYYFLRVPSLGLEFHPFSVAGFHTDVEIELVDKTKNHVQSVSPANKATNNVTYFGIGAQAKGSWTDKLADSLPDSRTTIAVQLMGPFGSYFLDMSRAKYNTVVMYAAGTGVTSMLFAMQNFASSSEFENITHVTLVWAVRDLALPGVFASIIRENVKFKRKECNIDIIIHNTATGKYGANSIDSDLGVRPTVNSGRPQALFMRKGGTAAATGVFICGPKPFELSIAQWCTAAKVDYHVETFGY